MRYWSFQLTKTFRNPLGTFLSLIKILSDHSLKKNYTEFKIHPTNLDTWTQIHAQFLHEGTIKLPFQSINQALNKQSSILKKWMLFKGF